jgi:CDP-diacylglycerol--glycerol-3-phosphate 3-phosphatidyltransferase
VNIPNQITLGRIGLTVILFAVLTIFVNGHWPANRWLLQIASVLFVVAAVSDALDGYLARRWKQITKLGRVLDPFADKLLIIGTFVFLVGGWPAGSAETKLFVDIAPWMVVVIFARELFISVLRSVCESQGVDFSADPWGKVKMVVQTIAVALVLAVPAFPVLSGLYSIAVAGIWITVMVTLLSAVSYWRRAWPTLREISVPDQKGQE